MNRYDILREKAAGSNLEAAVKDTLYAIIAELEQVRKDG